MEFALLLTSALSSFAYIFVMLYTFYLLVVAKDRAKLKQAIYFSKVAIVLAVINLFCHMLLLDGLSSALDLIKIAGPLSLVWSTGLRIDRMPMTEAEKFEAEALRDLNKF